MPSLTQRMIDNGEWAQAVHRMTPEQRKAWDVARAEYHQAVLILQSAQRLVNEKAETLESIVRTVG